VMPYIMTSGAPADSCVVRSTHLAAHLAVCAEAAACASSLTSCADAPMVASHADRLGTCIPIKHLHGMQQGWTHLLFISLKRMIASAAAMSCRDSSVRGPLPISATVCVPGGVSAAHSALLSPRSRFCLRPFRCGILDADHRACAPGCCTSSAALLVASALTCCSKPAETVAAAVLPAAAPPSRACTRRDCHAGT
jgi:hypothetical protein